MEEQTEHKPQEGAGRIVTPVAECYRCGAPIPEGGRRCPDCHRPQYRTCYCANRIPITAEQCPVCGASWQGSVRVMKHKTHGHRVSPPRLARTAVVGAVLAIVVAAIGKLVADGLVRMALPPGEAFPADLSSRLVWAVVGAGVVLARLGERLATVAGGLAPLLGVALAGAILGVLYYLVKADLLRLRWVRRPRHKKVRRRRAGLDR